MRDERGETERGRDRQRACMLLFPLVVLGVCVRAHLRRERNIANETARARARERDLAALLFITDLAPWAASW